MKGEDTIRVFTWLLKKPNLMQEQSLYWIIWKINWNLPSFSTTLNLSWKNYQKPPSQVLSWCMDTIRPINSTWASSIAKKFIKCWKIDILISKRPILSFQLAQRDKASSQKWLITHSSRNSLTLLIMLVKIEDPMRAVAINRLKLNKKRWKSNWTKIKKIKTYSNRIQLKFLKMLEKMLRHQKKSKKML